VHGNPVPHPYSDGGKLSPVGPDSRSTGNAIGVDSEIRCHMNQQFFQKTKVEAEVLPAVTQPDDRVADELPGAIDLPRIIVPGFELIPRGSGVELRVL